MGVSMSDDSIKPSNTSDGESPPSQNIETSSSDLKSRKFIAYIISMIVSLCCFIGVYLTSKDISAFDKFLNFTLWALVAYIGGNSAEKLSDKFGSK